MIPTRNIEFPDVYDKERVAIAARRKRPVSEMPIDPEVAAAARGKAALPIYDTIGLCLSGGGIRSAAFCLGAVQALQEANKFGKIDYLSTVSGGGYIGSSLSAHYARGGDTFPFTSDGDKKDTDAVAHIRDFSNYLLPRGKRGLLINLAIMVRGWIANIITIGPILLILAGLTLALKPTAASLGTPPVPAMAGLGFFTLTVSFALVEVMLFACWALWRSLTPDQGDEIGGRLPVLAATGLVFLAVVAFCELQPLVLHLLNELHQSNSGSFAWVTKATTVLSSLAAAVAALSGTLGNVIKSAEARPGAAASLKKWGGKFLVYAAAISLPILLWVIYVGLCFWGFAEGTYTPRWLAALASALQFILPVFYPPIAGLYLIISLPLLLIALLVLEPNANSLHRLYRDRLKDAFIKMDQGTGNDRRILLSQLSDAGPFHIINTALNIQNSRRVNKRGRNADFFMFSKLHCGSRATGYVETNDLENRDSNLDLATAMAISGAAISANMGSASIRVMSPTLALLNMRLGYWIKNPKWLDTRRSTQKGSLIAEMFGQLDEKSWYVYLTDGGHVENLGLYELLRRRCQLIIVIDAEADPDMNFGALVRLERYARIDLGVRIELPWAAIKKQSLEIRSGGAAASLGPHCAVGCIEYASGVLGYLLYVKSSLTGDENDYVSNYARRYSRFPHETTGDQFFSEEQFEAYRALGFHALYGCLSGRDVVETRSGTPERLRGTQISDAHLREVARLLT